MDLSSFYSQFRDETAENIRALNEGLLAIEAMPEDAPERREQIDAIFRAMHTIKGSGRLLGFEDIGRIAHTCEHILGAVREGRRELDQTLADDLLRGGDAILELINASVEGRAATVDVQSLTLTLGRGSRKDTADSEEAAPAQTPAASAPATDSGAAGAAAEATAPAARAARGTVRQTIRVRVDRLDRLLNLAGELTVGRQAQTAHLQTLHELQDLLRQQERMLLSLEAELKRLRFSATQRESLDRHINGVLNAGEHADKLVRTQVERFEQHAT
ncbi:MAG TPA: Hpt domain-containing protein, partial [Roseiflexaceae bacterium]|nr:Hpt domain-containing protein [Roseiflexaceae bacterium]